MALRRRVFQKKRSEAGRRQRRVLLRLGVGVVCGGVVRG